MPLVVSTTTGEPSEDGASANAYTTSSARGTAPGSPAVQARILAPATTVASPNRESTEPAQASNNSTSVSDSAQGKRILGTISSAVKSLEAAGHSSISIAEIIAQMLPEVGEPITQSFLDELLSPSELEVLVDATQRLLVPSDASKVLNTDILDPRVVTMFNAIVTLYAQFGDISFFQDEFTTASESVLAGIVLRSAAGLKYRQGTEANNLRDARTYSRHGDAKIVYEVGERLGLFAPTSEASAFGVPPPPPANVAPITASELLKGTVSVTIARGLNASQQGGLIFQHAPSTSGAPTAATATESASAPANPSSVAEQKSTSDYYSNNMIRRDTTGITEVERAQHEAGSHEEDDLAAKSDYRLLCTSAPPIVLLNTEGCLVLYFREGPPPKILQAAFNIAVAFALALRMYIIDRDSTIRPLGLRACRHLTATPAAASLFVALSIDILAARALEKEHKFLWERMQAMRLIRQFWSTAPFAVTHAIGHAILAVAETTKDPFVRAAMEGAREICRLNPGLASRVGIIDFLFRSVVQHPPSELAPQNLAIILKLLDDPVGRSFVRDEHIMRLFAALTTLGAPVSTPEAVATKAMLRYALVTAMRTATGLIAFASNPYGLPALIKMLSLPPTVPNASWSRALAIDIIHELLATVSSHDLAMDIARSRGAIPVTAYSTASIMRSHVPGATAAAASATAAGAHAAGEIVRASVAAAQAAAAATEWQLKTGSTNVAQAQMQVLHGLAMSGSSSHSYRAAEAAANAVYADAASRINQRIRREMGLENKVGTSHSAPHDTNTSGTTASHLDVALPDSRALLDVAIAAAEAASSAATDAAAAAAVASASLYLKSQSSGKAGRTAHERPAHVSSQQTLVSYVDSIPVQRSIDLTHQYAVLLIAVLIKCGLVEELAALALLPDGHREAHLLLELLRLASCLLPPSVYEDLIALTDIFRDAAVSLTAAGLAGSPALPGRVAATSAFWQEDVPTTPQNQWTYAPRQPSLGRTSPDRKVSKPLLESEVRQPTSVTSSDAASLNPEEERKRNVAKTANKHLARGFAKDQLRAKLRRGARGEHHLLQSLVATLRDSSHSRRNSTSPEDASVGERPQTVAEGESRSSHVLAYLRAKNMGLASADSAISSSLSSSVTYLLKPKIPTPLVSAEDLQAHQILYFARQLAERLQHVTAKLKGMPTAGLELLSPALDTSRLNAKTVKNEAEKNNPKPEGPGQQPGAQQLPTNADEKDHVANVYAFATGADGAGVGDAARRYVSNVALAGGGSGTNPSVGSSGGSTGGANNTALESLRMRIALALARRGYSCLNALAAIFQNGLKFAQLIAAAGSTSGPNASLAQLSTYALLAPGAEVPTSGTVQTGTAAACAAAMSPISLLAPSSSLLSVCGSDQEGEGRSSSAPGALARALAGAPAAARATSVAAYLSYEPTTIANSVEATSKLTLIPAHSQYGPWPSLLLQGVSTTAVSNTQGTSSHNAAQGLDTKSTTVLDPGLRNAGVAATGTTAPHSSASHGTSALPAPAGPAATAPPPTPTPQGANSVPIYLVHGINLGLLLQLTDVDRTSRQSFAPWITPSRPLPRPPALVTLANDMSFVTEDGLMALIRKTGVLTSKDPSQWDFALILRILETAYTPTHRCAGSNAAGAISTNASGSGTGGPQAIQPGGGPSGVTGALTGGASLTTGSVTSATFNQLVTVVDAATNEGATNAASIIGGYIKNSAEVGHHNAGGASVGPQTPANTGVSSTSDFTAPDKPSLNSQTSNAGSSGYIAGVRGGAFSVQGAAASAAASAAVKSLYRPNSGAGPLLTPAAAFANIQATLKTKFFKRLLSFLRPDKRMFCDLDWNVNHMLHAKVAHQLISVLLSSTEGLGYVFLHQLVDLILQHLVAETHRAALFVHATSAAAAAATTAATAATSTVVQAELQAALKSSPSGPSSTSATSLGTSFIQRLRRPSTTVQEHAGESSSPPVWWPFTPAGMAASTGTSASISASGQPNYLAATAAAAAAAAIAAGASVAVPQGASLDTLSISDALATSINAAAAAAMSAGSGNAAYAAAAASAAAAVAEAVAAGSLKRFRPFSKHHQTTKLASEYINLISLFARSPVGLTWLERYGVFESIVILAQSPSHDYLTRALIRAFDYVAVPRARLVLEAWVASGSSSVRFAAIRQLRSILKRLSKTRVSLPVTPIKTIDPRLPSASEDAEQPNLDPELLPEAEAWALDLLIALLFSPDSQVALSALATLETCCSGDVARLLHLIYRGVDFEPFGGFAFKLRLKLLSLREGFHFLHATSYPSSAASAAFLQAKPINSLSTSTLMSLRKRPNQRLAEAARVALQAQASPRIYEHNAATSVYNSIIHPGSTVIRSPLAHALRSGPKIVCVPRPRMSWIELLLAHWTGAGATIHARAADSIVSSAVSALASPSSTLSPLAALMRQVQLYQQQQQQQPPDKAAGVLAAQGREAAHQSGQGVHLSAIGATGTTATPHLVATDSKVVGPAAAALAGIPPMAAVQQQQQQMQQQMQQQQQHDSANGAAHQVPTASFPALNRAGLPLPTLNGPPIAALTQPHIPAAYSLDPLEPSLWATSHPTETTLDSYLSSRLDHLPWTVDVSVERADRGGAIERLMTDASIIEGYGDAGVPLECVQIMAKCQAAQQSPAAYIPTSGGQGSLPLQRLAVQAFLPSLALPEPVWGCETPGAGAVYVAARILGPSGLPEPYLVSPDSVLYARLGVGAPPLPSMKAAAWAAGATNAWAAPAKYEGTEQASSPKASTSGKTVINTSSTTSDASSNLALASMSTSLQSAWTYAQNMAAALANGMPCATPFGVSILGVFVALGMASGAFSPTGSAYAGSSGVGGAGTGATAGPGSPQANSAVNTLINWLNSGTPLDARKSTAHILTRIAGAAANAVAASGLTSNFGVTQGTTMTSSQTPPYLAASLSQSGAGSASVATQSLSHLLGLTPGFGHAAEQSIAPVSKSLLAAAMNSAPSLFVGAMQHIATMFPVTKYPISIESSPYQMPPFLGSNADSAVVSEPATFSSTTSMMDFLAQQQALFQQQQQILFQMQQQQQQQQQGGSSQQAAHSKPQSNPTPVVWGGGVASHAFESAAFGSLLSATGPQSPHGPLLVPLEQLALTQNAIFGSYLRAVSVCTPREREAHVVRKHLHQSQIQQQQSQVQGRVIGQGTPSQNPLTNAISQLIGHSSGLRHTTHVNEGLPQLGMDVRLTDITRAASALSQLHFQQQLHNIHTSQQECEKEPFKHASAANNVNVFVHPPPSPPSPEVINAAVTGATALLSHTYYTTVGNTRWNFVLDPNEPCFANGKPRLFLTSVWFRIPSSVEKTPSANLVENPMEALSKTPEGCAALVASGALHAAEATLLTNATEPFDAEAMNQVTQEVAEHNQQVLAMVKERHKSVGNKLTTWPIWQPRTPRHPHPLSEAVKGQLLLLGHFGSSPSGFATLLRIVPRAVAFVIREAAMSSNLSTRGTCLNVLALWSLSETGRSFLASRGILASQVGAPDESGTNHGSIGAVYPVGEVADKLLTAPRVPFMGSWALSPLNTLSIRSTPIASADADTEALTAVGGDGEAPAIALARAKAKRNEAILEQAEETGVITRDVLDIILGHISNLCNPVSMRTSHLTLKTLRDKYRKLFSSPAVLAETLKLLASHRLRENHRRHVLFELFMRVPLDAKTLAHIDQLGI